jgi:hypothetical protein
VRLKPACLAAAALLSLAAPAVALADPHWEHGGPDHDEWRRQAWREHEWREHGRREPASWSYGGRGWGPPPRCFIESRGAYAWDGGYAYRPVRVCYR